MHLQFVLHLFKSAGGKNKEGSFTGWQTLNCNLIKNDILGVAVLNDFSVKENSVGIEVTKGWFFLFPLSPCWQVSSHVAYQIVNACFATSWRCDYSNFFQILCRVDCMSLFRASRTQQSSSPKLACSVLPSFLVYQTSVLQLCASVIHCVRLASQTWEL